MPLNPSIDKTHTLSFVKIHKTQARFFMKRGSSELHDGGSSSDLVTSSLRAVAFVVIAAHRFRINQQLSRIPPSAPASLGFILLDVADEYSPAPAAALLAFPPHLHSELQGLVRHRDSQALLHLGHQTGVADRLHTSLRTGLGAAAPLQEELASRQRVFGTNVYPRKHSKSFWHFLWSACQDVTLGILMLCAVLSLGFGIKSDGLREGWYDGASIAFAVILVIVVTAVSNYRQGKQFEKLNHEKESIYVQAIRQGRTSSVSIFDLVVGDLLQLRTGDQVPADGLCIEGHSLLINESSVTGESDAFIADPIEHPFLLSGCKVEDGFGLMLVTAVGIDTEWGKIMATISTDNNEQTPLQKRLDAAAKLIGYVGLTVALLVLVILLVFYFTGHTSDSSSGKFQAGKTSASDAMDSVVHILTIAVTIIVVAVPEGLPLAVTLTLAYSMRKMMADKALVRRLAACETMGSSTTICTDKTGTLTLNQMTVVKSWLAGVYTNHEDGTQVPVPIILKDVSGLLYEAIAQNTTGNVFMPPGTGVERAEVSGSPTEKALLRWGLKTGMQFEKAKAMSTVFKVNAFNSKKKRAGVAVNRRNEGRVVIHWKGAAEIILSICSKWMDGGLARDMTLSKRKELLESIEKMAEGSLRCIAFAYCEVRSGDIPEFLEGWELPETDLTLLAVVGMKDPCRPGVRSAVSVVKKAGVKVRMVTGDNLVTAKAIAKECGILEDNEAIVVEGSTFRNWTEMEMSAYLPRLAVLARALPSDKLLLVESLQARGNVVALTGDGTNDAPALHKADIGLSMGVEGTEVAKESSDIIILDDNFSSIVKVVRWGRSISSNIQKFLQFQLTVNVAALVVNFVAAVSSGSVPLTAVQLLWVNLIMDTLGALALATEPPTDSLMLKPPVAHDEPLISNIMWRNLALQAAYQVTILLTLQFRGESLLHLSGSNAALVNRTIIFNTFVFCQIFNEVNARQPQRKNIFKGILDNRLFMGIIALTLVLQVVMVEFLERFASTMRLDWHQWLICMGLASLSWPIGFLGKFIPVPSTPFSVQGIIKKATC